MTRIVHALVSCRGQLLGAVAPFSVESPWWPDTVPVTAHLDAVLGVASTVVRLVAVRNGDAPAGGEVTYHVEVAAPPAIALEPAAPGDLFAPHPLRAHYAEPGAVAGIGDWAATALSGLGVAITGPITQIKTWNLSCVLRIPTDAGAVWCKSTREFETPEHAPIGLVGSCDPALVPSVLAHRPGDTLLADVDGTDCWDADAPTVERMVRRWVGVQNALAGRPLPGIPSKLPASLPDRLERVLPHLAAADRAALAPLLRGLPDRLAGLAAAGLPLTLVHGDFHSGNWRAHSGGITLMDWSDAFEGHPANDLVRLVDWPPALPTDRHQIAVDAWCGAWRAAVPGSDPERAIELIRPLVYLEAACFYQGFLDGIEPSERLYHEGDATVMVRRALAAIRSR